MNTWPIPRAPGSFAADHLGDLVTAYVDRRLDPASLLRYDRHLVGCAVCRASADAESDVLASLRSLPMISSSLQSMLLGMQQSGQSRPGEPIQCPTAQSGPAAAPAPVLVALLAPTVGFHRTPAVPQRVRTVRPSAPAQHHSPVRAALIAGLAAGASVAAAWTLGLAAAPVTTAVPTPSREGQRTQQTAGWAAFGVGLRSSPSLNPSSPSAGHPSATGDPMSDPAAGGSAVGGVGRQVVAWAALAISSSADLVASQTGAGTAGPGPSRADAPGASR